MGKSNIEWTDMVWNPVTGCTKVSEGCANCYAERMAMRFTGHFNVTCHPDRLNQPLHWKKPRRIFVCSMGDLFHEDVLFDFIDQVFFKMVKAKRHNFLILTKRPTRMWKYIETFRVPITTGNYHNDFSHIWLGVTAENQEQADKRIPILLQIPAAKRFVSIEPMLGDVALFQIEKLDWIIVGAESGQNRRECKNEWVRKMVEHCQSADVPVFVKQLSIGRRFKIFKHNSRYATHLSKNMAEWPEDLRVREFPS